MSQNDGIVKIALKIWVNEGTISYIDISREFSDILGIHSIHSFIFLFSLIGNLHSKYP